MLATLVTLNSFETAVLAAESAGKPVVAIDSGRLQGVLVNGVKVFKGIPYAAAPVGERRWAPPAALEPWTGVRSAENFANACIQKPGASAANGGDPGPLSEDCLYLNVWTPTLKTSARLPVIFWIHGGAYVFGAGGLPIYDGSPMAKKGAVFVSLNYRLGPLGFFAHPSLEKTQSSRQNNFALLDQVAALKWVKKNIARFGGDADDVTIMGQSAGGKSVLAHFASPLSRGLFKKGIALSVYAVPDAKHDKAVEVAAKVASALGLDGSNATLEDLRKVPAERFGEIADKDAALGPVPIAGDDMLPQSIAETFAAGKEAHLPLIIGNTSDDASVVAAFGFDPEALIKKLGAAGFALKLLYPGVTDHEKLSRQALRDAVFTMNTRWVADRHSKRARTWRAYFDYSAEKNRPSLPLGVPHGNDVPFYLGTGDIYEGTKDIFTRKDRAYARKVSGYMYEFACTGTPGHEGAPEWQDDRLLRDRTLVFGPETIELERNFMRARLNVLIGIAKVLNAVFAKE